MTYKYIAHMPITSRITDSPFESYRTSSARKAPPSTHECCLFFVKQLLCFGILASQILSRFNQWCHDWNSQLNILNDSSQDVNHPYLQYSMWCILFVYPQLWRRCPAKVASPYCLKLFGGPRLAYPERLMTSIPVSEWFSCFFFRWSMDGLQFFKL